MNLRELHEKRKYLHERENILLHDKIKEYCDNFHRSIGAKSEIRINNQLMALNHIKELLINNQSICEIIVKDLHELLMKDLIVGGVYRNNSISISDTDYIPPSPLVAYQDIKYFYHVIDKKRKEQEEIINLAAYTHLEFVNIHPFPDGNGRTARTLMNYQLLESGLYPIIIEKDRRDDYIDRIKDYQLKNNIGSFTELVYELENNKIDCEISKIKIR